MGGSLPRLMALYEEYGDLRDRFEILAFHEKNVKSFEDLDAKMAERKVVERWGGKTLPFPILLDATGETQERYGIEGFPTNVLIDPEGRIVKGGSEKMLEERLEEIRRSATAYWKSIWW